MWNLRNKLLIPILLVSVLGLGLASFSSYYIAKDAVRTAVTSDAQAETAGLANVLTLIVQSATIDMQQLSRTLLVKELLRDPTDAEKMKAFLALLSELSKSKPYYQLGTVLDSKGTILASTAGTGVGDSRASRDYYQTVMQGKPAISKPTISGTTKTGIFVICVPVFEGTEILGSVFVTVDLGLLSKLYVEHIRVAERGYAFIVSSAGDIVAHNDRKMIMADTLRDSELVKKVKTLTDTKGYFIATAGGKAIVYYYQKDPATGWWCMVQAEQADIDSPITLLRNVNIIIGICAALGTALVIFLVVQAIVNALNKGVAFASAVAGGDLDQQLTIERTDEIGTLATALRTMVQRLKDMIATADQKSSEAHEQTGKATVAMREADEARQAAEKAKSEGMRHAGERLAEIAAKIVDTSGLLAESVEQASSGATEQRNHAQSNATAMDEMNATVLEVARSAGSAAGSADATKDNAVDGAKIVSGVVHAIGDVEAKTQTLKRDLNELGKHAEGIGAVMTVITDIADQTNLLALNAAIEAARAGEAGRGFAVVADEVRKLAEKTMIATKEVGDAVKSIQNGTSGSIHGMEDAAVSVGKSAEMVQQAGASLQTIVDLAESTADMVRSIATAGEQQSAASEEINQGANEINRIADETAMLMGRAHEAMDMLHELIDEVQNLVSELKNA